MLCVQLKEYTRACGSATGGISEIAIFDPNDLNFTQSAPVGSKKQPYSAVSVRPDVDDGPTMFLVSFQEDEAEWTHSQSRTGASSAWEHELILQLPQLSQDLTDFLESLDAASSCCGLGIAMRLNDGKIFIAGEKYVNGDTIPKFRWRQDGTEGTTGKLFSDFNGSNVHLKATYSRNLYEYSGTWASILALTTSGSGE